MGGITTVQRQQTQDVTRCLSLEWHNSNTCCHPSFVEPYSLPNRYHAFSHLTLFAKITRSFLYAIISVIHSFIHSSASPAFCPALYQLQPRPVFEYITDRLRPQSTIDNHAPLQVSIQEEVSKGTSAGRNPPSSPKQSKPAARLFASING